VGRASRELTKEQIEKLSKIAAWVIVGGFVLWVGSCVFRGPGESRLPTDRSGDEIGAWVEMQFYVEEQLKSPSSADFPFGGAQKHVKYLDGGRYRVTSYVDAQNSLGASIRTHFDGVIKKTADGWLVESFEFRE